MTDNPAEGGQQAATDNNAPRREVGLQKIYVKDMSFESPNVPEVFSTRDWRPQTNLNLRTSHRAVNDNLYEVVLTITVDAKMEDKTTFLVELQQAGLFQISGYEPNQLNAILGSFCPNNLFPYARQAIADAVQRGGFPEFLLQPIDFDALYAQSMQEQAKRAAEAN